MRKYILVLFLLFNVSLFSQENDCIIKASTSHFILDSIGRFSGSGAEFVEKRIAESQFLLIGEQHNIHLIETFVSSLIPLLKQHGYNHYVAEIGPIAEKKLSDLSEDLPSLRLIHKKFTARTNLPPFGFFGTEEELITLQQLKKYDMNLCGIDFENYASYLFLIEELYRNADQGSISKHQYADVCKLVESAYAKGVNNFNPNLMDNLLQDKDFESFLSKATNHLNASIIEQFKLSLAINHQLTLGFWQRRADNMKSNLLIYYHSQCRKEDTVKMIIKLGAAHTARGTSFNGNIEVGNMIYELANVNQSKSFSIITFPRYMLNIKTHEIEDLIEEEDKALLKYTLPDQWTIIDLESLNSLSLLHNVQLSRAAYDYIQKFDAIIIPPVSAYSENMY